MPIESKPAGVGPRVIKRGEDRKILSRILPAAGAQRLSQGLFEDYARMFIRADLQGRRLRVLRFGWLASCEERLVVFLRESSLAQ